MTEKHYGGELGVSRGKSIHSSSSNESFSNEKSGSRRESSNQISLKNIEDYKKAGKIASEVVKFAKSFIKPGMPLLEIADKIEEKITELGGKPAFPVNLSINEIAAHYTPSFNDTAKAHGLLKVDLGVHVNGCVADTAFSLDLENSEENKKLIEAAELALKKAEEKISIGEELGRIGAEIENAIKSKGFLPIQNLSGHAMDIYNLHSGITIPNYNTLQKTEITEGVYAIEPFSTNGFGAVRDGKPSGIFKIDREGSVRDNFAREVLAFIIDEYQTLPFCSRWICKKFSSRGLLALRRIEEANILHSYPQLIERNNCKVAQAEHTILLTKKEKIITTQ